MNTGNTYTRVTVDEVRAGDEEYSHGRGEWVAIAEVHRFGDRRDMVKIVYPNGGSSARPASHGGAFRRATEV